MPKILRPMACAFYQKQPATSVQKTQYLKRHRILLSQFRHGCIPNSIALLFTPNALQIIVDGKNIKTSDTDDHGDEDHREKEGTRGGRICCVVDTMPDP